jgi:subtilisin family serine protease
MVALVGKRAPGLRVGTLALSLVLLTLTAMVAPVAGSARQRDRSVASAQSVPGQVLVSFRGGADRAAVLTRAGLSVGQNLPVPGLELLDLPRGITVGEGLKSLNRQPGVRYAEPNYVNRLQATIPNDQYFNAQWEMDNVGQYPFFGTPDADIDAAEAWDVTTGSSAVTVAIADDGVIFSQPDLAPNLRSTGYDFIGGDTDPTDPMSGSNPGHGTYVAGVVGAVGNNGYGVAGVNWNVGLEPIRVCSDLGCPNSDLIDAIIYARNQGVPVFNASLGGTPFNQAVKDAIDSAPDVLFVFSAGNLGADLDATGSYPCSYTSPNVICVAATDEFDQLWSHSNYGATSVDLAAPGVNVVSTNADYAFNPIMNASGTSAAAPAVAGAAALLLSATPGASPAQLKATIFAGVDPLSSLSGKTVTGGRLNVDRLLPHRVPPPTTTLPNTELSKAKINSKSHQATFTFASTEAGSTFGCKFDKQKKFSECRSPKTYKHLQPGKHTFSVRATDGVGNTDETPAKRVFLIKR